METLLSVVIPVYNGAAFVTRAVESVNQQPLSDLIEIVLVNDGSKDNSGEVCDRLSEIYNNVKVIHKENEGVSVARNTGLLHCSGKYVAFLDCDDKWAPNFFDEELKKEFDANPNCDIFQFGYMLVDSTMRYEKAFAVAPSLISATPMHRIECDYNLHGTYIHRRDFLCENRLQYPPGIRIAEDMVFIETSHYLAKNKLKINKLCYVYLLSLSSVAHTNNREKSVCEKIKCAAYLEGFYSEHGAIYNTNHSKIIGEMLPEFCAENSFSYCKEFFVSNNLLGEFEKDRTNLPKKIQKILNAWQRSPRLFWFKCKIFKCPIIKLKRIAYKSSLFLKITSFIKYKLLLGFVKSDLYKAGRHK